ncbi:MAG TPA: SCO family protein [Bryobacteraceae bacterium]|jgi:protein SCO1/2|nr:SCO family protein [Bryobacteraceae bacterium]HZP32348.1 SCO family protein [Candidatus Acidoferrales bacterium]
MNHRSACFSFAALVSLAGCLLLIPARARAQLDDRPVQTAGIKPDLLRDVGLDQKLGDTIPLDLTFRDEHGRSVPLRQFFGQRPVILTLVYYQCPMLCTEVLNGLMRSAKELPLAIGKDFSIVTLSIDPSERPVLANVKHELYTGLYGKPGAPQGWHFLTGDEPQIKALAQAVGFRYAYDSASGQFAHPSGIMLLTPQGKLARYFYGISFPARDLRLGLVEASQEKIGSPIDQILLYCYHYDPATGKYGLLISRVIQMAGALTVLSVGLLIMVLFRREHYGRPRPQS